jgi:hypothetical protein
MNYKFKVIFVYLTISFRHNIKKFSTNFAIFAFKIGKQVRITVASMQRIQCALLFEMQFINGLMKRYRIARHFFFFFFFFFFEKMKTPLAAIHFCFMRSMRILVAH